jgi:hypothetical protein
VNVVCVVCRGGWLVGVDRVDSVGWNHKEMEAFCSLACVDLLIDSVPFHHILFKKKNGTGSFIALLS